MEMCNPMHSGSYYKHIEREEPPFYNDAALCTSTSSGAPVSNQGGLMGTMGGMMGGVGGMMNAGPPGGGPIMMNPAQAGMMMPWAAMMGPMMDPSMMMWGGWGGMNMMGPMGGDFEALPQAQHEVIKFKNVVLHPPPPNSLPTHTRERPPGCKTVFIGGLPENVTEEILREMFANCGEICSLRLSKKNFAHIRFTSMESVDRALHFSGYRMKIDDKDDKPNTGRLHVDFAQARDDLHEWECQQRQLERESRHRERFEDGLFRSPSPPSVTHYTDHEATLLIDALKDNDAFQKAVQTLISWFERGDCNRRTACTFYTLIQSCNGHVRRLLNEKKECAEELERMKAKFRLQLESIVNQYELIDRVFTAANKQKSWDHFTKAQRKNLEMWRKQLQTAKARQEAEYAQHCGGQVEMEMSDGDHSDSSSNESSNTDAKRRKVKQDKVDSTSVKQQQNPQTLLSMANEWIGRNQLRDENDTLKCQMEALKNEIDIIKLEAQNSIGVKDKQMKCMQMALQGMQQQLMKATQLAKKQQELNQHHSVTVYSDDGDQEDVEPDDPPTKADSDREDERFDVLPTEDEELDNTAKLMFSGVDQEHPTAKRDLTAKDARIISLCSCFLVVHPFGATIDQIWSYLSRFNVKIRTSDLDELLDCCPSVFGSPTSDPGVEKRWKLVCLELTSS